MKPVLDSCNRWRFLILLGMLLVLLVVQPILFGSASPVWFDAFFLLVIVALLFSFSRDRKWRVPAYMLGILAALLSMGGHVVGGWDHAVALLMGHLMGAMLLLLGLAVVVKAILISPERTLDSVFGAICGYLLLGMAWALLYSVVDSVWPGSFAVRSELAPYVENGRARIQLLVYYSFVTLTTVGYGDATRPCSNLHLGGSDDRPILPHRSCGWSGWSTDQPEWRAILDAGLARGGYGRRACA
jgi:hypothetical protein